VRRKSFIANRLTPDASLLTKELEMTEIDKLVNALSPGLAEKNAPRAGRGGYPALCQNSSKRPSA
jgi:hypothetical protein